MKSRIKAGELTLDNLWDWWGRTGSQEAFNSLLTWFDPLAQAMADRAAQASAANVPREALAYWARAGLGEAIEEYVDHRTCMFEPFAIPRIRQRIIDELAASDAVLPDPANSLLHQGLAGPGMRAAFVALLADVEERERAVLSLYYLEGVAIEEIAGRLGKSVREVTEVHLRAMEELSMERLSTET